MHYAKKDIFPTISITTGQTLSDIKPMKLKTFEINIVFTSGDTERFNLRSSKDINHLEDVYAKMMNVQSVEVIKL